MRLAVLLVLLPRLVLAQAEPAPPDFVPSPHRADPVAQGEQPVFTPRKKRPGAPKWRIWVQPRLSLLLGAPPSFPSVPPTVQPTVGYGAGVGFGRALVTFGQFRFGFAFGFAYDRISTDISQAMFGVSHATFAPAFTLDGVFAERVRPFLSLGGGLDVGVFRAPEVGGMPVVEQIEALGLVQLALGLGVRVYEGFEVGVRAEGNFLFSSTSYGTPARTVFSPGLVSLGLDLAYLF
jgi:hypothetical protein